MNRTNRILLVTTILTFGLGHATAQGPRLTTTPHVINVGGEAEVRVEPDEVILTLGVETLDEVLAVAKAENDRRTEGVIRAAGAKGIDSKHVQTDFISITPDYDSPGHRQKLLLGYTVRRSIVLTLRDVSRFEDVLTDVLEGGANYVQGIQFRTTELRRHREKARAMAIQAARDKAADLSAELGRELGQATGIREGHSGWWSPYNSWWNAGSRTMSQNVVQQSSSSPSSEGSVAFGQISVTASVAVTFELM